MYQIITGDCFTFLIGQHREGVAGLLHQLPRLFGGIDTDRHRTNAGFIERRNVSLDAPQLGVADDSPVTAIEDQQHALGRLVVDWLRQQRGQSNRLTIGIAEVEFRRLLSDSGRRL